MEGADLINVLTKKSFLVPTMSRRDYSKFQSGDSE